MHKVPYIVVMAFAIFTCSLAKAGQRVEMICVVGWSGPVKCRELNFRVRPNQQFTVEYLNGGFNREKVMDQYWRPSWARIDLRHPKAKSRFFTSGEIPIGSPRKGRIPKGRPFKPHVYVDAQGGLMGKSIKIRLTFR